MGHKVSVIIPAYNCASYLPGAIGSVLNQTYKDYEIIIVDDGSTDNTKEALSLYRDKIKYIFQNNGGVSKARNTGMQEAEGDHIAFLDADDRWYPCKLELQMLCFDRLSSASLIFSDFSVSQNDRVISEAYFYHAFNIFKEYNIHISDIFSNESQIQNGSKEKVKVFWGNIFPSLFLGNFILPSSAILNKECLKTVGLFNANFRVAEETEFFLRFSKQHEMAFINKPLVQYKLADSSNLTSKHNTDILIKNALSAQLQAINDDSAFLKNNKRLVQKAIGTTYRRLAYFYFSELNKNHARINAIKSMESNPWQLKALAILLLSFLPATALKLLATAKKKIKTA